MQRVPTVEDETKPPESMREKWFRVVGIVMAQNAARREGKLEELEEGQSLWRKQPVDNLKDMMDAKEKILKTYQVSYLHDCDNCKATLTEFARTSWTWTPHPANTQMAEKNLQNRLGKHLFLI